MKACLEPGRGVSGIICLSSRSIASSDARLQSISPNPLFIQNEQFLTRLGPVLPIIRYRHEITTTPVLHGAPGLDRLDTGGAAWVRPQCRDALGERDFARRCAAGSCRVDQTTRQCGHGPSGSATYGVAGHRSEPGTCIRLCRHTLTRRPGLHMQRSVACLSWRFYPKRHTALYRLPEDYPSNQRNERERRQRCPNTWMITTFPRPKPASLSWKCRWQRSSRNCPLNLWRRWQACCASSPTRPAT